ncbi:Fanconi anemia group M protein isoform X5 [Cucumis melo var. makuwa]|uniref:Fanconi anemia group M protein isoform X5 n=1 Tax=Cucumis melo var. makuwa TaxID=1194695 RepID=A0A5D3CJV5_CUCMM|nr:Fanconi anemia group M protein isoform X5 [Cucumis melo var. makuwa]TYK12183.1 Fanconi anemia group M protein isoform X5 [Cucumis melo var. makuwa]
MKHERFERPIKEIGPQKILEVTYSGFGVNSRIQKDDFDLSFIKSIWSSKDVGLSIFGIRWFVRRFVDHVDYSRFDDNVKAFVEEEAEVSSDAAVSGDEDDKIMSSFDSFVDDRVNASALRTQDETIRPDMMAIYSFNNKNGKWVSNEEFRRGRASGVFNKKKLIRYSSLNKYSPQDWYLSCASEVMVAVCQLV